MACLEAYGKESVVINWLDPDDEHSLKHGMWNAIVSHWTGNRDLIHIDHDMVFIWENLREMVDCDNMFCCCPSWGFGTRLTAGLAFTKFSAKLQRLINLDDVRHEMENCTDTPKMPGCHGEWWGVEYHLIRAVMRHQKLPCNHMDVLNDHSQFGLRPRMETEVACIDTDDVSSVVRLLRTKG